MQKFILGVAVATMTLFTALDAKAGGPCFKGPDGVWRDATGSACINTILTAVPMLRIAPDARGGALGDAGIATTADANSAHYNSAKLAFADKDMSISATYTPWLRSLGLNDVYLAYVSGYRRIDKLQTIGFSLRYFSLGSIAFTDENGNPLGQGRPNEWEMASSFSRQLSDNLSVGVAAKVIYSNLAAGQTVGSIAITPGWAGAADFSLLYKMQPHVSGNETNLNIGLSLSNIGTKISYTKSIDKDFIPANIGLGAAWTIPMNEFNKITLITDINKLMVPTPIYRDDPNYDKNGNGKPDYKEQSSISGIIHSFNDAPGGFKEELRELMYSFGAEYWYDNQFALRAGYYSEDRTKGNRKYFTAGMGLKYNVFGLNFSYLIPTTTQRNPLDNTLRFSLIFDFGGETKE